MQVFTPFNIKISFIKIVFKKKKKKPLRSTIKVILEEIKYINFSSGKTRPHEEEN